MAEQSVRKRLVSGQTFADKFRLECRIGSGGMGVVWRAWNVQLDIPVAIKVMNAQFAHQAESVARFEREAKAAARIRGRHVVTIYEHGVHDGLLYMAMELLEGEDLNQRLKRAGRLSLQATAHVVGDLCKALQRAHELGVVHRDLKPANVFLTRDGDEEIAKVLDFGIAKLMVINDGGFVSETGQILGTPTYMSPEQIRATKHVDARADLWSLAVIAFRALTGEVPFSGSMFDITSSILGGPTPIASAVAPDLAPEVDAFFARALARDIDRRFQSARELSDAFNTLAGRVVLPSASETPLPEPLNYDPVSVSEMDTQRLPDRESKPPPAVSATDQTLAMPPPVHEDLANTRVEGSVKRRDRSWMTWVVLVSTILVIVAALLMAAFYSKSVAGRGSVEGGAGRGRGGGEGRALGAGAEAPVATVALPGGATFSVTEGGRAPRSMRITSAVAC
jgi:serine/threonine-protein kinase